MSDRSTSVFQRAWLAARDNSLLMIAGAVIALIWANLHPASYTAAMAPLHFAINDIAMALFFGLAMKEIIEATAPGGALHSFRTAALPVIAAAGGMAGPATLYAVLAIALGRRDILGGWAIPCATDIAFSYLVIRRLFRPSHPAVPFLLLLAVADDALGLLLLAAFYPAAPIQPIYFVVLVGLACVIAWRLRVRQTRSFWPYVAGAGAISWAGFYLGGLHPALALVPVLPFVPHAASDAGVFVEPIEISHDTLNAFARWWRNPVEFVLFFFALANAGVAIREAGVVTVVVLVSLLVGKPMGILGTTWLAERAGFRRPDGLPWSEFVLMGMVAGIGFTVALFFATASFPPGATLDQAKLGALLSVSAGALALLAGRAWRTRQAGEMR